MTLPPSIATCLQQLRGADAAAPPDARDAWFACRVLPWEVRQRARLGPLRAALQHYAAARAYVEASSEPLRIFFAMLAAAYAQAGVPPTAPPPADLAAEAAALAGALAAEVAAQAARGIECGRCPFTGTPLFLLPDTRVALPLALV
jgi:hypothetical protein